MTYEYNALIVRVIDADTVVADIDLGFDAWLHGQHLRLVGLNAREKSQPGGLEARDYLTGKLPAGTPVLLATVRPDKFGGRYDAEIFLDGQSVNRLLIDTGWAAAWTGVGVRPLPPWPRTQP